MPFTAEDILRNRAAVLESEAVSASHLINLDSPGILFHAKRVAQHLSNPNCSCVAICRNGPDDLVLYGQVSIESNRNKPIVLVQNFRTQWRLHPLKLRDVVFGGEFTIAQHLRDEHTDAESTPCVLKTHFSRHVRGSDQSIADCVLKRHQGVAVQTQMQHDGVAPDLHGWAVVMLFFDVGLFSSDLTRILMNLNTGEFQLKRLTISTPRWRPIKFLDFRSDWSMAFLPAGVPAIGASMRRHQDSTLGSRHGASAVELLDCSVAVDDIRDLAEDSP